MSTNINTITKIIIEGFQSHRKTTVIPAAAGQLTVLTGPSDTGKTAIIRALRWVLYNIPQGTDYIRAGTSTARVTVEYLSGHQVVRERTRSYNRYIVVDPAGERQVYEGFGSSVPLEVQLVTGVRPINIADLEVLVNLSEQLDGPFLGSKSVSAPVRAKVLGKLAGTEEIDHAARQLGTDMYRRRQDEKGYNSIVLSLDEKIKAYDYLEEMDTRIEAANKALAGLKVDIGLLERLEELDVGIQEADRLAREKQQVAIDLQASLDEVEPLLAKVGQDVANEALLSKLSSGLIEAQIELTWVQGVLDGTAGACAATELISQVEQAHGEALQLSRLARDLAASGEALTQASEVLEATKQCAVIENLAQDTERVSSDLDRLKGLSNNLSGVGYRIDEANKIMEYTKGQPEAERLLAQATQDITMLSQLQSLEDKFFKVCQGEAWALVDLTETKHMDNLTKLTQDTETKLTLYQQLNKSHTSLKEASRSVIDAAGRISDLSTMTQEAQQKYIDLLTRLGVCPTCGAMVAPERLKEVV